MKKIEANFANIFEKKLSLVHATIRLIQLQKHPQKQHQKKIQIFLFLNWILMVSLF